MDIQKPFSTSFDPTGSLLVFTYGYSDSTPIGVKSNYA